MLKKIWFACSYMPKIFLFLSRWFSKQYVLAEIELELNGNDETFIRIHCKMNCLLFLKILTLRHDPGRIRGQTRSFFGL